MPNRPQPRLLQVTFGLGAALRLYARPLRPRRWLLWSALCFAADLVAIPRILRSKPGISSGELAALRHEAVPVYDRVALQLPADQREAIRRRSDAFLRVAVALPFLLLLAPRWRRTASTWIPDYVWGHALSYTIYTFSPLGPTFSDKYRPVVYRDTVPEPERTRGNNRNSQYSGHTGNAAFAGAFLASLTPVAPVLKLAIGLCPPLLVGSLRVRAQKHFPGDIAVATLIGGAIALALTRGRRGIPEA